MPYYIFAVKPFAQPERLAEYADYKQASVHAKSLRAALPAEPRATGLARIKIMFAADPLAAEDLLLQLRHAGPSGDE